MKGQNQKSIVNAKDDIRDMLLKLRPGQYREILSVLDMVKAEITFMAQNRLGVFHNTVEEPATPYFYDRSPVQKRKWIEPLQ